MVRLFAVVWPVFNLRKCELNVHYWMRSVRRTAPIIMWKGQDSVYCFQTASMDSVHSGRISYGWHWQP